MVGFFSSIGKPKVEKSENAMHEREVRVSAGAGPARSRSASPDGRGRGRGAGGAGSGFDPVMTVRRSDLVAQATRQRVLRAHQHTLDAVTVQIQNNRPDLGDVQQIRLG